MTFRELAEARGISKLSAVSLVRRHGWRRQRDNQGHVRALVPLAWASHEADNQHDNPADTGAYAASIELAISALREAHVREIATLRDDHDRLIAVLKDEQGRLVAVLEAKAQAAEARAGEAERAAQFERARAEELTARLAAERRVQADEMARLHHQLDEARAGEAELTALRHADELRRARGLVARLSAAWRGE
jgi:hypothetical protein